MCRFACISNERAFKMTFDSFLERLNRILLDENPERSIGDALHEECGFSIDASQLSDIVTEGTVFFDDSLAISYQQEKIRSTNKLRQITVGNSCSDGLGLSNGYFNTNSEYDARKDLSDNAKAYGKALDSNYKRFKKLNRDTEKYISTLKNNDACTLEKIYETYIQFHLEVLTIDKESGILEFLPDYSDVTIKELVKLEKKLAKERLRKQEEADKKVSLINWRDPRQHNIQKPKNPKKNDVSDSLLANNPIRSYFDEFIGLEPVKNEVEKIVAFLQVQKMRQQHGVEIKNQPSRHMVFTGNPGTGKTEMARLLAKIFYEKGIIRENIFIEADRTHLIGGYLGQTAIKTTELIESALGGVLFIDEAYAIKNGADDTYGDEAVSTLLKLMEDQRDNLTVIVAGYKEEMQMFLQSNPGLKSRFNRFIEFPNYSADELFQMLMKMVESNCYEIENIDAVKKLLLPHFETVVEEADPSFANARFVRNYFERIIEKQCLRIVNDGSSAINQLTVDDFNC